jgi:endonuclease G, mitochondrial
MISFLKLQVSLKYKKILLLLANGFEILEASAFIDIMGWNLEDYKQAEWVFYEIKKERILGLVGRTSDFRVDEKVKTSSSNLDDYRSSGYDRGHLAPSADFS